MNKDRSAFQEFIDTYRWRYWERCCLFPDINYASSEPETQSTTKQTGKVTTASLMNPAPIYYSMQPILLIGFPGARRSIRQSKAGGQTCFSVHRILHLPLVPRDGA